MRDLSGKTEEELQVELAQALKRMNSELAKWSRMEQLAVFILAKSYLDSGAGPLEIAFVNAFAERVNAAYQTETMWGAKTNSGPIN